MIASNRSKFINGLEILITEERLAGIESYNNEIKQITCNSFIYNNFITNIFYPLPKKLSTRAIKNKIQLIIYNFLAALFTILSKTGLTDYFGIITRKFKVLFEILPPSKLSKSSSAPIKVTLSLSYF